MFETFYPTPERSEQPDTADRYQEVPLGVEAAWPPAEPPESPGFALHHAAAKPV